MLKRLTIVILLLAASGCNGTAGSRFDAGVREWKPGTYPEDEVNLIVMGDWGSGYGEQRTVAGALGEYLAGAEVQFHGLISTGDNFYVNLRSTEDRNWVRHFEAVYDARRFNLPFYAVLGNHDYEHTKEIVQVEYMKRHPESRWRMPARWYRIEMPDEKPIVTILMLDSNRNKLGRGQWEEQMRWLGTELARPRTTRWLIVCAHHPLYTNGSHGDNGTLQRLWGPLLEKFKVDFYLAGHDHDLQHLQPPGRFTTHVVSGAGGKKPRPMRRSDRGPFSRSINGFVHMRLTDKEAIVRYIDAPGGRTAHLFQRAPGGTVQVLGTTGREPPTTQPALRPGEFEEMDKG